MSRRIARILFLAGVFVLTIVIVGSSANWLHLNGWGLTLYSGLGALPVFFAREMFDRIWPLPSRSTDAPEMKL